MLEHKLKRESGGKDLMGWIRPVCSCGWKGRKEYAHNDYQHSNIREQESDHLRKSLQLQRK